MPLAFRQWHLYRFDFMVEMRGVEPLSENRLPTLSTSVAGILNLPPPSAYRQALSIGSP